MRRSDRKSIALWDTQKALRKIERECAAMRKRIRAEKYLGAKALLHKEYAELLRKRDTYKVAVHQLELREEENERLKEAENAR